ncbi:small conductance calcium-activated potassium channel protein 1-like [Acomys russatus]|uniref:small conductance calcium-activated potassium channel protein 1-like n=1 Tax=Acomys russatus TaxID=60746 RepID=UPI0021E23C9E|nr:small conductance calcium-activated potassium channel protein 1-like [Acomys russatus]
MCLSPGWVCVQAIGNGLLWARIVSHFQPYGLAEPNLPLPHPHRLRSVKIEQGKVNDQANTLADLAKAQSIAYEVVSELQAQQEELEARLAALESRLDALGASLQALPSLIA